MAAVLFSEHTYCLLDLSPSVHKLIGLHGNSAPHMLVLLLLLECSLAQASKKQKQKVLRSHTIMGVLKFKSRAEMSIETKAANEVKCLKVQQGRQRPYHPLQV